MFKVGKIKKLKKGKNMKKKTNGILQKIFKNTFSKIILVLCVLSIIAVVINIVVVANNSSSSDDVLDNKTTLTANAMYVVPSNPTKYQETLYKELSELIDGYDFDAQAKDDQKNLDIVISVVKNFIADFYTWTNKSSSYSVGGQMFVYGDQVITFQSHARDTYYKDLDGYIAQYGRSNLPEVNEVTADAVFGDTFEFNGEKYTCFYAEASWTYKDCDVDTSSWNKQEAFYVIYNETTNKFEIVQFWATSN